MTPTSPICTPITAVRRSLQHVWRVVSLLQFVEGLTDRQAAHAVKARLDWKYALGLELAYTGFDFTLLSAFRARLAQDDHGQVVFDSLLLAARRRGLLGGGHQRSDSTHVLARPQWFDRYAVRPEESRYPKRHTARVAMADQVGAHGTELLSAVLSEQATPQVRDLRAVEVLRQVWVQQFQVRDGTVRWWDMNKRAARQPPPALPYDLEARPGSKQDLSWGGYKAHLTEICDAGAPHLITNVITTPAPVPDVAVTEQIHAALAERDRLPAVHIVDAGYIDAEQVALAQQGHGLELLGPLARDTSWNTSEHTGFDNTQDRKSVV